jgi:hypothetical protein
MSHLHRTRVHQQGLQCLLNSLLRILCNTLRTLEPRHWSRRLRRHRSLQRCRVWRFLCDSFSGFCSYFTQAANN